MADGWVTSEPVLVDLGVKWGRAGLPKGLRRDTWVRNNADIAEVVVPDGDGGWEVKARLALNESVVSCDRWVYVGVKPAGNGLVDEWHCLHPPKSEEAKDPW